MALHQRHIFLFLVYDQSHCLYTAKIRLKHKNVLSGLFGHTHTQYQGESGFQSLCLSSVLASEQTPISEKERKRERGGDVSFSSTYLTFLSLFSPILQQTV